MPSLLTTPSRPDLLARAEQVHHAHGYNFAYVFNDMFTHHYVFKTPEAFLMGMEDPKDPEAWLIWWAECFPRRSPRDMLALFMRFMPHYRPKVGWCRQLKGHTTVKYYSTNRLLRFIETQAFDEQDSP